MKILAIGNSFSQDATRYLQEISEGRIFCRNMYIPGCALKRHCDNIRTGAAAYEYQENAKKIAMISIGDALRAESWDYITLQQVSGLSGLIESYEPNFSQLYNYVREQSPESKIVLHRTWAYETGFEAVRFGAYNYDRRQMMDAIIRTTDIIAKKYNLDIIKVGDFIHKLREHPVFSVEEEGLSLSRDGLHLTYDYGRYAAGLVWYDFFRGENDPAAKDINFAPKGTDPVLVKLIKKML